MNFFNLVIVFFSYKIYFGSSFIFCIFWLKYLFWSSIIFLSSLSISMMIILNYLFRHFMYLHIFRICSSDLFCSFVRAIFSVFMIFDTLWWYLCVWKNNHLSKSLLTDIIKTFLWMCLVLTYTCEFLKLEGFAFPPPPVNNLSIPLWSICCTVPPLERQHIVELFLLLLFSVYTRNLAIARSNQNSWTGKIKSIHLKD